MFAVHIVLSCKIPSSLCRLLNSDSKVMSLSGFLQTRPYWPILPSSQARVEWLHSLANNLLPILPNRTRDSRCACEQRTVIRAGNKQGRHHHEEPAFDDTGNLLEGRFEGGGFGNLRDMQIYNIIPVVSEE